MKKVIVLGGAGFVGSTIARRAIEAGCQVTVIDGLVAGTGGRAENLAGLSGSLRFQQARIQDFPHLGAELARHDVIVDAAAWTMHLAALHDPLRDMDMNLAVHLHVILAIPEGYPGRIIYLGSRGQFGAPLGPVIDASTPMVPNDVQGVHKAAAESMYRIYSRVKRLRTVSIRFPNCFGPRQMTSGPDVGLVGNFVNDLLAAETVEIFGLDRTRNLAYAPDVAQAVVALFNADWEGFTAVNLRGRKVSIRSLAETIRGICARGEIRHAPIPDVIKNIDMGEAEADQSGLTAMIGTVACTDLEEALRMTVDYFKETKRDMAL